MSLHNSDLIYKLTLAKLPLELKTEYENTKWIQNYCNKDSVICNFINDALIG